MKVIIVALYVLLSGGAALAQPGQFRSTLSMDQARSTALAIAPGTITSEELENEGGRLIYSFDIRQDGRTTEVNVDAVTDGIVSVTHETPSQERAEKQAERRATNGHDRN